MQQLPPIDSRNGTQMLFVVYYRQIEVNIFILLRGITYRNQLQMNKSP